MKINIFKIAFASIIIIISLCYFGNYTITYAAYDIDGTGKERDASSAGTGGSKTITSSAVFNPNDYKPKNRTTVEDVNKIEKIGNRIIGFIRTIGSITSVAVLIVLGIKYMAGSIEEKAQYKNSMIPYIIGAVFVFGITNILATIVNIAGVFE